MAAHPFGPIEKSLIVGYYKRKSESFPDSVSLRPCVFREVSLQAETQSKLYSVFDKDFQLKFVPENPSHKKMSPDDCHINWKYSVGSHVDMSTKGLGYRIQFRGLNKPTFPEITVYVLDYLGRHTHEQVDIEAANLPFLLKDSFVKGILSHLKDVERSEERRVGKEGRSRGAPYH